MFAGKKKGITFALAFEACSLRYWGNKRSYDLGI
jgi:hypothetical protein